MTPRYMPLLALLALAPAALAGCGADSATPTEGTVRLAVVADGAHGGRPFAKTMTQEVTAQPAYAGDADGSGSALLSINAGQGEVCWELAVANLGQPTASHIHQAPAGVRGPIVVTLSPPDAVTGRSSGCATGLDRALLEEILANPASFYVNVHTVEFPQSAVRAQLAE